MLNFHGESPAASTSWWMRPSLALADDCLPILQYNDVRKRTVRFYEMAELTREQLLEKVAAGDNLSGTDLRASKLELADLRAVNLSGADLCRANLYFAKLTDSDLSAANLQLAVLDRADLTGAFLTRANLRGASLERANLFRANLWNARLEGVQCEGANLDRALVTGATYDKMTNWPNGFDPEGAGAVLID